MKRFVFILLVGLLFASCSSGWSCQKSYVDVEKKSYIEKHQKGYQSYDRYVLSKTKNINHKG